MIIGIVGKIGSGKTSAVEYLSSKGFKIYRLSNEIIEEYNLKSPNRTILQDKGNELRKKFGNDILARKIWNKIEKEKPKNVVLDGIRNIGELNFFKVRKNFYLISVNSRKKVRFERLLKQKSHKGPKSWGEFISMEKRDLDEKIDFGQQNEKVIEVANFRVENDGTIEDLHKKIEYVIVDLNENQKDE